MSMSVCVCVCGLRYGGQSYSWSFVFDSFFTRSLKVVRIFFVCFLFPMIDIL